MEKEVNDYEKTSLFRFEFTKTHTNIMSMDLNSLEININFVFIYEKDPGEGENGNIGPKDVIIVFESSSGFANNPQIIFIVSTCLYLLL